MSAEQTAFRGYRELHPRDRHVVDKWRAAGFDWVDSVLRAGVLGSGPREHPEGAALAAEVEAHEEALAERVAAVTPLDDVRARDLSTWHEAGHLTVAQVLGAEVDYAAVGDDGTGCTAFRARNARDTATIAAAGEVAVALFGPSEYARRAAAGCDHDRRMVLA